MDFTLLLKNVGINDIPRVGGKNASLGEMLQNLTSLGVNIPDGFVVTVAAYKAFLKHNSLDKTITETVEAIDYDDIESLRRGGMQIRQAFLNGKFPDEMSAEITARYEALSQQYGQEMTDVAVRSSATAEDLPDASFAGQQESYLNVRGAETLMDSIRKCFASLFTDRAISYRRRFGYDLLQLGLSVCVQKMVRSDLGTSGVAFSIDTESGFKDAVVINGTVGLGEMLVQGAISPDEFIVFKPLLKEGYNAIIEKKLGNKDKMMIYGKGGYERVKVIQTEEKFRTRFCLSEENVIKLAKWVVIIEDYYTKIRDKWTPMDVEWAIDGLTKELFIVQARPETIHSQNDKPTTITEYIMEDETRHEKVITSGIAVGDKIGSGKANIIFSMDKRVTEGHEFTPGAVLVTDMTDPDWEPIMKKASAIITNKGGRTCHAAIIAREMGIPAIVGCGNATDLIKEGMTITASCAEGDKGYIYEGEITYAEKEHDLSLLPEVKTDIMLNVASPGMAFQFSHLPNKGVGLAREEFIINNYIEVHPLALMNHRNLNDAELTAEIEKKITGYPDEETFFINKLADGIAKIASSFYPNKTIVRFSDFKTNEYYNLLGGKHYEPNEENPMIGWRGASRYYSEAYKEAFGLECRAIKKVREEMGLKNVTVMVPFCRTVEELIQVTEVMKEYGLVRGEHDLELFLMAEVPSNILMAAEFAEHIDGFSIGSNDLTQLTLGLDRDSSLVAHLYDERNPAVKRMLEMLITTAKKAGVKVGICGQGPSDFPDFAQFLVSLGIDSISVTPDSVIKTVTAIAEAEKMIEDRNIALQAN
ncbi:MAG: phosphoenolpyruvate synthase [Flavobacterium sp. MedPE-SWcel]|uniref:phosphoenolpyruvate synthase n=1 Tax=uncultured Flavobacterium sp. TaxID=165435 RepID=UPI00090F5981|nr:phosphoenolpyruvate synthase [uncultured Flavobacterium sp.]OIQ15817.1 MAG: phosphoenolpyruvate synthase [Flavobacterium sp. MedPE-SWcel]